MEKPNTVAPAVRIDCCRLCGNTDLVTVVDIGEHYLSSIFPTDTSYHATALRYPLEMVMCVKKSDGSTCGLVQLAYRMDLSPMYQAYPYTSASNSSMTKILENVAESGKELFPSFTTDDVILDIGGNDGTLLSFFKDTPSRLISIDAAQNVKSLLESPNFTDVRQYFSQEAFTSVSQKKAKLIFSIAMFYHLNDPLKFVKEVAECLDEDGVWIIQMAYLPAMLRTNMYNNILHEHAGYYAVSQMKWAMEQAGLEVFDVMENNVYGGSFRTFVKKKGNTRLALMDRYQQLLEQETHEGLFDLSTYRAFTQRIEKSREDLRTLLKKLKDEGKTVWIYGAATAGNTILQYCEISKEDIVAAADSNPFKFGKLIISSDIPITDEATMRAAKPDYLLALPYSFVEGFMKREAELIAQGTKFIVPLPEVKIL